MRRSLIALFASLFLLLFVVSPISAHHRNKVLGEATTASELVFPPVTSGPGFILPDSPLFFLDQLFQTIRLATAFTPEQRAKVRASIAGERLAELRIMVARDNQEAINIALYQLTNEVSLSADSLSDAAAQGKDVSLLAKELNETIKFQRSILGLLASQSRGALKLQFKAARKALKEAKIEVEDELPEADLENEIAEGLHDEIEEEVEDATESAQLVEDDLDELVREASEAAEKALNRREEALRKAIAEKNEEIQKAQEKLLKEEQKKQEKLSKLEEKEIREAREAVKKAQEAAIKFDRARQEVSDIKNQSVGESSGTSGRSGSGLGESSENKSSGGDSSGSGSSGSGSSGSGSSGSGKSGSSDDDDD